VSNRSILSLFLFFFLIGLLSPALAQKASDPNSEMGSKCWTAGKTSVSDLSPEEKQKLLGLKLPEGYWEWRRQFEPLEYPIGAKYPTRFDWRDYGGVTPARSQGDCGSCWDFCAVSALEAMVKIYGEVEMNLSEQQVLSCTTYGTGCDGSYPEKAYQYMVNNGMVKEKCMPYQADHWVPCTADTCEKWAKMSHWTPVCEGPNEEAIKNAIYNYGPVSTLIAAGETFHYYNDGCYDDHYMGLNHCVALVGWDDTLCGGAWIGKNSWGEDWGMEGFFYIKRTVCLIGTGTDLPHYIFHRPLVWWLDYGVDDSSPGGDGDGRPEPGETVRLDFTLKNVWSPLDGVEVTVSPDTNGIMMTDDYSYLGHMDSKDTLDNTADPMEFSVPENFPPRRVYFTFHASGDSGGGAIYTADTTFEIWVGNAEIIIVDDDAGSSQDYSGYYTAAMDSLKEVYDIWDTQNKADPDFSFCDYEYLIWYTGDHKTDLFTQAQAESLMSFLDAGGNLFVTSQDAAEVLSGSPDPWDQTLLTDYLHVGYDGDNDRFLVVGEEEDEVGDSMYIYPNYRVSNQTSKDNLVLDSLADPVLSYAYRNGTDWWFPSDSIAGAKFQNEVFRTVIFGFGLESIKADGGDFHDRYCATPHFVIQRVLDWFRKPSYVPGDANGSGQAESGDVVYLIAYMFRGGPPPNPMAAGDPNANCAVEGGDVVYLISYLFKNGPAPLPGCA
jgi:C1A family cysteine protease